MTNNNLLIIIPAYNEEEVIENVIKDWLKLQLDIDYKLLIINDGSKDRTSEIIDNISQNNKKIIKIDKDNSGHGNTIIFGYNYAIENNYDLVFQTDSDNQFTPNDFERLFLQLDEETDLILGIRKKRNDGFIRVILSKLFLRFFILIIFGKLIHDPNVPYRLISRKFLRNFLNSLKNNSYLAPNILMSIYANKVKMIDVSHYKRTTGSLTWSPIKLLIFCFNLFIEIIRFKFKI